MPRYERIYVTGATGLIGSHIAERLRARGDGVVALVRSTSDTAHLESIGCELVTGDLMDDPRDLARGMRGADAVVHAAAKVFQGGSRAEYLRINVEGTTRVLEAAALASPRVVHLSSVAVYAGLSMDEPLTEDRWREADPDRQNRYPASKHLAERAAWEMHEAGAVRLTTVRPSVVYGERDRSATPLMVGYASLPLTPLLAAGRHTVPVVYAGNVARGVVAALDQAEAVGRAYNLALDLPLTTRELVERVAESLGRRPRVVPVPAGPLLALTGGIRGITRALPAVPTVDWRRPIRSLSRDNPYDSTRARLELGWSGLVSHQEGFRRTMAWWHTRDGTVSATEGRARRDRTEGVE